MHRPVFVDLAFPSHGVYDIRLKQPKSWIELDLDDELFPISYDQAIESLGTPHSIEEWGQAVEYSVDLVYRKQQAIQGAPASRVRGLPKKFRGRCQPVAFQKISVQSLTPATRPGDFSPSGEISDATRKTVLHMRRLQSFLRRYQDSNTLQIVSLEN